MSQQIELDDITVWGNLPPGMGGSDHGSGTYLGGGFTIDGMQMGGMGGQLIIPYQTLRHLQFMNESHYYDNIETEDRNYLDPDSDNFIVDGLVNYLLPELGKFSQHVGELLSNDLSANEFRAMKAFGQGGNFAVQLGMSGAAAHQQMSEGVPASVAIGTQVMMVGSGVAASALGGMVFGAPLGPPGAVIGAVLAGIGASMGFSAIRLESTYQNFFMGVYNSIFPSAQGMMASFSATDNTGFEVSDYEFYRIVKEIVANPEKYPEGPEMIMEVVAKISQGMLDIEIDALFGDDADAAQLDRSPPIIVDFAGLTAGSNGKEFSAPNTGKEAILFQGDNTSNTMMGGDGINWFMPIVGHIDEFGWNTGIVKNVIVGGEGYNVLDFSRNETNVEIMLTGNDIKNEKILKNAKELAKNDLHFNNPDLTHLHQDNMYQVRGGLMPQDMYQGFDTLFSMDEYKNIDMVIGSAYDDVLIGDWIGGITMTGGMGDDIFVIHGGSNRIVFNDSDFLSPFEEGMTRKEVHGLVTAHESEVFNFRNYVPDLGIHYRIDPDVLDFSNMDADLTQEGQQSFDYIFLDEFSGTPGELRLDLFNIIDYGDHFAATLQGDRTGDGIADFEVVYYTYDNLIIDPWPFRHAWIDESQLFL